MIVVGQRRLDQRSPYCRCPVMEIRISSYVENLESCGLVLRDLSGQRHLPHTWRFNCLHKKNWLLNFRRFFCVLSWEWVIKDLRVSCLFFESSNVMQIKWCSGSMWNVIVNKVRNITKLTNFLRLCLAHNRFALCSYAIRLYISLWTTIWILKFTCVTYSVFEVNVIVHWLDFVTLS
jgi:hypothetical protein